MSELVGRSAARGDQALLNCFRWALVRITGNLFLHNAREHTYSCPLHHSTSHRGLGLLLLVQGYDYAFTLAPV